MERILLLLIVGLFTVCSLFAYVQGAQSVSNLEHVNVDNMLSNPQAVQAQIRCLKCTGPCDKIGTELKRVIPYIASTNCRTCSPNERTNMGKIVRHVQTNYPRDWAELNVVMRSGRRC